MTDLGKYLRCVVTASNASGAGTPAASNVVGPVVAASAGGSAWDPTFKSSFMLLSAGNTVATMDGSSGGFAHEFARSTVGKSGGKRYFEIKINDNVDLAISEVKANIGLVDSTYVVGGGLPGANDSKGLYMRINDGVLCGAKADSAVLFTATAIIPANNDVFGFAYDIDATDLTGIYHNGVFVPANAGTPYPFDAGISMSGNMFIFCEAQWQAVASSFISFTINGSGPFVLTTLPSGYVAWDT